MRIKKSIAAIVLAALTGVSFSFSACKTEEKAVNETAFSVYLGEYFTLPFPGEVKDSAGNDVLVNGGAFPATDRGGYTFTANGKTYKIRVIGQKTLSVAAEYAERYVLRGAPVAFPAVTAKNASGATSAEYALEKDGESHPFDAAAKSFVPEETGEYSLTVRVTDGYGNKGETAVRYYAAEENDDRLLTAAVFDEPSGVNHFTRVFGFNAPEFTEEKAIGDERGSTKLTVSGGDYFSQTFQMTNFRFTNVSGVRAIYFYIFNDSGAARDLWVNWKTRHTLAPGKWNEVYINTSEIRDANSRNDYYSKYITEENINGLDFAFNYNISGGDTASFYFSNMYADPVLSAGLLNGRIEKANGCSEEKLVDSPLVDRIFADYNALDGAGKSECADGYSAFIRRYVGAMVNQTEKIADDKLVGSDMAKKLFTTYRGLNEKERAESAGYSAFLRRYGELILPKDKRLGGVCYAFNTPAGVQQIEVTTGVAEFSAERKYGYNVGSLLRTPTKGTKPYELRVTLNVPLIEKTSDAYFYVWVEGSQEDYEASFNNPLNNSLYAKTRKALTKGAWTKITIPATTAGLTGCRIQLNLKDWKDTISEDTKFYVSPIYFASGGEEGELPTGENELPFVGF